MLQVRSHSSVLIQLARSRNVKRCLRNCTQIIEMVKEYGIDYFDSALLPLDNFITRGTEHFLGKPEYLVSLNAVRGPLHIIMRQSIPTACVAKPVWAGLLHVCAAC